MDRTNLTPAIAVLAGRRIDEQGADYVRFPLVESDNVYQQLLHCFRQEYVHHLICSAACGADILALEAAEELTIPTTIVLPFSPHVFRKTSVADRPGSWGERFDNLIEVVRDRNDLVELGLDVNDKSAFSETNNHIIQLAISSLFDRKIAFVVWEGQSRGGNDSTAEFLEMALSKGFEKKSLLINRS